LRHPDDTIFSRCDFPLEDRLADAPTFSQSEIEIPASVFDSGVFGALSPCILPHLLASCVYSALNMTIAASPLD
jgi:hypothetical protein